MAGLMISVGVLEVTGITSTWSPCSGDFSKFTEDILICSFRF